MTHKHYSEIDGVYDVELPAADRQLIVTFENDHEITFDLWDTNRTGDNDAALSSFTFNLITGAIQP